MDYAEEFKSLGASELFVEMWPKYAYAMRKFCNEKFQCEKHTGWGDDVENLLLMMKALPLTHRKKLPFKDMIEKLITFKVVRYPFEI